MNIVNDLRLASRGLLRNPGFAGAALITLTLSIGACCTIFGVLNNALFRPLPFKDAERLVLVWEANQRKGVDWFPTSPANFVDWQRRNQVFDAVAAFRRVNLDLTERDNPERISSASVSPDFFPVLGVQPRIGRVLQQEDQNQRTVVISEGYWRRRFASDPQAIGKPLVLNGESYIVVGVMPASFRAPREAELWIPMALSPSATSERSGRSLTVYGRLKRDVSFAHAQTEMSALARELEQQYPGANQGWEVKLVPIRDQWIGQSRTALLILQSAVLLVVLIGCANVANLMLARMQGRRSEFALRTALGANRSQLLRQMLTESFLLTLVASLLGLLWTSWTLKLLPSLGADKLPWLDGVTIDIRVVAFTLLISLVAGSIIGLLPAFQLSQAHLTGELRDSGTRSSAGAGRQTFQRTLVVIEVALALVLVIGAGLLVESYQRLQKVDLGFQGDRLLTGRIVLSESRFPQRTQWVMFFDQVLDRLKANPRIQAAAIGTTVPFNGAELVFDVSIPGREQVAGEKGIDSLFNAVSADYFRAMVIPLVKGREFSDRDRENTVQVAIVNQTLARSLTHGEEVIGKSVVIGARAPREVVGVVKDTKYDDVSSPARPVVYVPYPQKPWELGTIVVRTRTQPEALEDEIRRSVGSVDRYQPVFNMATMKERLADSMSQRRFNTILLTSFAVLALVLAFVGVYGLISYQVSQSTQEMGIRIALGAQRRDVLKLILGRVLTLVLMGVGFGLIAAFGLTRFLGHLLYEVSATDVRAFLGLGLLLPLLGIMAGYLPARRAMRVEPVVALKYQ